MSTRMHPMSRRCGSDFHQGDGVIIVHSQMPHSCLVVAAMAAMGSLRDFPVIMPPEPDPKQEAEKLMLAFTCATQPAVKEYAPEPYSRRALTHPNEPFYARFQRRRRW